jgi:MFS family permease
VPSTILAENRLESASTSPAAGRRRHSSILRRNLALCTGEGLVAMPIVYLTLPGNFIIAMLLTQTFALNEVMFGVIVSLPSWCNVLQLVAMPFLARRWSQKAIALGFSWLHLAVWIALAVALPFVPTNDVEAAGRIFFLLFAVSAAFQALVGVSWTSWVQEWVPDRLRGKYFGRRNRFLQLSTVAFLLGAGETLTRTEVVGPVLGFQIVIGFSVLVRALSIFAQQRILATSAAAPIEGRADLRAQLRLIAGNRPLLWLFGFGAAFGLTTNIFGPFFNVFMYDALGQSVSDVGMLIVITNVTGAIALPAWGQFLDRYGNRPVMSVALFMWMAPGFFWALLTPESSWALKLLFASGGVFQAGFVLGQFNILLKLVPPAAKTAAISLNVAVTSVAAAIAPIVGGLMLDAAFASGIPKLTVYHGMSVIHHAVVILSIFVLLRVAEPKSSPLGQVVGAMRSHRQILALFGLSFLVNYVFTREPRRKPGDTDL